MNWLVSSAGRSRKIPKNRLTYYPPSSTYTIYMLDLIANWPAPDNICALTTTRLTGMSMPPYDGNNLALHVGDVDAHVQHNRRNLVTRLSLPNQPAWLLQTHTNHCVVIDDDPDRNADAAVTRNQSTPLAIMTADCLPILLCNHQGTEIAAIHAGWKGLLNGIVENTLKKMYSQPNTLMAWVGPAICQACYETGKNVRDDYIQRYPFVTKAFQNKGSGVHANLPMLAELILNHAGVNAVYQSNACTYEQEKQFYSYRRESQTGRIASLIWFKDKT